MEIAMNTIVTMSYELKDSDGNLLESSKDPVSYLHGGYDQIFPKVEEEMHGKKKVEVIEIGLEPADAFGEYNAELVRIEPISAFPEKDLKVGLAYEGEDESGDVIIYYIKSIVDKKVEVDGNHPWAGQRIIFKAIIENVRKANKEETENRDSDREGGHAH